MKKILCWVCLLAIMVYSCSDENFNDSEFLAGDSFTDSNIRLVFMDTLSVQMSTMKFDNIITSSSNRILVGKYEDPEFGTIEASSFFELSTSKYTIDAEAKYDSMALLLKFDKYYYNDTLQINTIHIKQLTEKVSSLGRDNLYNTDSIPYSEENLGELSFRPRPTDSDTLEIRLSDDLGKEIFKKFQEKEIVDNNEFKDYFKGLSLQAGENDNGSIIGFSVTGGSFLRLYYSVDEVDGQEQDYTDFSINRVGSPATFFNRIISTEPNDYLKNLTDQEINLSSTDSENKSYIQSGTGLASRIEFPNIKSLYDLNGEGTIMDAVLKVRPAFGSYNEQLRLKDTLDVYVVDQNNELTGPLVLANGGSARSILIKDNEEFNDVYYEIPLGSYLDKLLLSEKDSEEALILLPNDYGSAVDRLILNGPQNEDYQTALELTYAIYD